MAEDLTSDLEEYWALRERPKREPDEVNWGKLVDAAYVRMVRGEGLRGAQFSASEAGSGVSGWYRRVMIQQGLRETGVVGVVTPANREARIRAELGTRIHDEIANAAANEAERMFRELAQREVRVPVGRVTVGDLQRELEREAQGQSQEAPLQILGGHQHIAYGMGRSDTDL